MADDLIQDWRSLTVLVIGDVMLDCYLHGTANRLCQEGPVPVVALHQRRDFPGGAANVAANLASLGAQVQLLSVIGNDAEGDRLRQALAQHSVATEGLCITSTRATLAKHRVMAANQLLVRFDQGSTEAIAPDLEDWLLDRLTTHFAGCDAVMVSDYGYGMLTPRLIQTLAEWQARHPRLVAVDSRQLLAYREIGITLAKPNYMEAVQLLGVKPQVEQRAEQMTLQGDRLLTLTGATQVAVTLDVEGAVVLQQGEPAIRTMAQPVPAQQTSGAGDTYFSAFTLALAAGADTPTAATIAAAATRVVVQQIGTTLCSATALRAALVTPTGASAHPKILGDRTALAALVQRLHQTDQMIVLTNGCFDILHAGHVAYLAQAKALGDVLIVGVNEDATVQQLKGSDRPVNPLLDRLTILAALNCVDYVVPFAELTPHALIRAIRPQVFVKGGDYTRDMLPEALLVEELGGTVKILPYVRDRSTTGLMQQIRDSSPSATRRLDVNLHSNMTQLNPSSGGDGSVRSSEWGAVADGFENRALGEASPKPPHWGTRRFPQTPSERLSYES